MTALSLRDLTRSLAELRSTPNFFDSGAPEQRHLPLLEYALASFTTSSSGPLASTTQFGSLLFRRCFPGLDPVPRPREASVRRGLSGTDTPADRPVLQLTVARDGSSRHAVVIVSSDSTLDPDRGAALRSPLRALEGTPASVPVTLYTTTAPEPPPAPTGPDQVLTGDAIHSLLEATDEETISTWLLDEYRDWITTHRLEKTLFRTPAFQDWYFTGRLPPEHDGLSTASWPTPPTARRRVYEHLLHRLAGRLRDNRTDDAPRPTMTRTRRAAPPEGTLPVASLDDGTLRYRLHHVAPDRAVFDLRLVTGPPRGADDADRDHWITIKKTLRARLREAFDDAGLTDRVDLPGYRAYTFQKAARDTSLCRVWLPPFDESSPPQPAVPPGELIALSPTLHRTIRTTLTNVTALAEHVEEWIGPT